MTAMAKEKTHTEQKNVEIKMAKRKGQSSDAAGVHLSSQPCLASIYLKLARMLLQPVRFRRARAVAAAYFRELH